MSEQARQPTKIELARCLRKYQTFGHGYVAEKDRADAAEAQVVELREALQMLWDNYLLVISDEQKEQVLRALQPLPEETK